MRFIFLCVIDADLVCKFEACFFCGSKKRHNCKNCPARSAIRYQCPKVERFAKVCKGSLQEAPSNTSACITPVLCAIQQAPSCLSFAVTDVFVRGRPISVLVDPGSSLS